jgi:hypothetical protein
MVRSHRNPETQPMRVRQLLYVLPVIALAALSLTTGCSSTKRATAGRTATAATSTAGSTASATTLTAGGALHLTDYTDGSFGRRWRKGTSADAALTVPSVPRRVMTRQPERSTPSAVGLVRLFEVERGSRLTATRILGLPDLR